MMPHRDEGYTDEEVSPISLTFPIQDSWLQSVSLLDKEELAYKLLSSLPISSLARLQRKIAPLLQLDIVALLPTELSLYIFTYLQYPTLLTSALVSRRWRALADDPSLWKRLCAIRGWQWREFPSSRLSDIMDVKESEDEGVGEDEDDWTVTDVDSDFFSTSSDPSMSMVLPQRNHRSKPVPPRPCHLGASLRHSTPSGLCQYSRPDYKLLHQTHILLRSRLLHSSYRLTYLQTRQTPNSHSSTIYCLQLHTFPDLPGCPGRQVLFTGSKDQTIRQWDLSRGVVEQVLQGVHGGSVLSLCVQKNCIISGGNDRKVVVWDLETGEAVKVIEDHSDSVLCVRSDDTRLVSCSKDRTVRTYLFPDLFPHLTLNSHRAAVNAVSISPTHIVSASGDRSIRLWDADTGTLLYCFEQHHSRGIASIDFAPPYILSGSSDKHLRCFDVLTLRGWCTSPHFESYVPSAPSSACHACGGGTSWGTSATMRKSIKGAAAHRGLVRSVALGDQYVVSGSYDQTIKVWDRTTGALVADLMGGHNGKVFSVAFDCAKIVSCGEDQRICIWDFAHGISTSFIKL